MDSLFSRQERIQRDCNPSAAWRRAEQYIVEEHDLTEDHSPWHDARTQSDEPIEIKSCMVEYSSGRIGHFKIWEYQWCQLACRGRFAFLVYTPDSYYVFATHLRNPPSSELAATRFEHRHPTMGYQRLWTIPWPEVIPLDEIMFGSRHHFTEYYSEEEIEETLMMRKDDD